MKEADKRSERLRRKKEHDKGDKLFAEGTEERREKGKRELEGRQKKMTKEGGEGKNIRKRSII